MHHCIRSGGWCAVILPPAIHTAQKELQNLEFRADPLSFHGAFPVVGAEVVELSEDVVDVALSVARVGFAEELSVDSLSSRALTSRKW